MSFFLLKPLFTTKITKGTKKTDDARFNNPEKSQQAVTD